MDGKVYRIHHMGGESIDCREADCASYQNGWRTYVDESSELGARQAAYIRHKSGRRFTEYRDETGITVFVFPAGQRCFARHRVEYANFQRRKGREDFEVIEFDRFKGEWNELAASLAARG